MAEEKPKLIRIEEYNGVWSVRHSPLHAPNPLIGKSGEPLKSWPDSVLEFICSDRSGLEYMANHGVLEPVEKFVRGVDGTHYATFPFGYLQVYRLRDGMVAKEGNWSDIDSK